MSRAVLAWLLVAAVFAGCSTNLPCTSDNTVVVHGLCQCKYGSEQRDGQIFCRGEDGGPSGDSPSKSTSDAGTDGPPADAQSTDARAQGSDAHVDTDDAAFDDSAVSMPEPGDDAALPNMPVCTSDCTPSSAMQLAVGWNHSCVLTATGSVWCWGDNSDSYAGQSAIGKLGPHASGLTSAQPVLVTGLGAVVELAGGRGHTCARLSSGEVHCWGENDAHQLGPNGPTGSSATPVSVPVSAAKQIAAGGRHSCAMLSTGQVACWGNAGYGELGGAALTDGQDGSAVIVQGLSNVAQVAVGYAHSCARLDDGTVRCWGWNAAGQIGNANLTVAANSQTLTPLAVDITETIDLVAGSYTTCSVWASQTPACWGGDASDNPPGQVIVSSNHALAVEGVANIAQLSLGRYHACARQLDGSAVCWGQNESGELGYDPSVYASSDSQYVPNVANVSAIGAGEQHTCAILAGGHVRCWGSNTVAQLGPNTTATYSGTPVSVPGF